MLHLFALIHANFAQLMYHCISEGSHWRFNYLLDFCVCVCVCVCVYVCACVVLLVHVYLPGKELFVDKGVKGHPYSQK